VDITHSTVPGIGTVHHLHTRSGQRFGVSIAAWTIDQVGGFSVTGAIRRSSRSLPVGHVRGPEVKQGFRQLLAAKCPEHRDTEHSEYRGGT
jgi:hypothetical protein